MVDASFCNEKILICFKKGSSKLEDSFADSDLGLNNTVRPKALDITDAAIYSEPYFSISSFAILNNWPPILIVFFSKSMVVCNLEGFFNI